MRFRVIALLFFACRLEPSDPAAEAAAILHKHPAGLADRMGALEALVLREFPDSSPEPSGLADSLFRYRQRLTASGFGALPAEEKPEALLRFLFDSLGIKSMDSGSLHSSLPGCVLTSRQGSCVGLALLALGLAEAMNVDAAVVFLPSHLFLRLRAGPDSWRNAELLRHGMIRSDSFYRETFRLAKRPWYGLVSRPADQALGALLFNLANAHALAGQKSTAHAEYRLVEEVIPDFPDALGCDGAMLAADGHAGAVPKLEASLAGDSLSYPAWNAYASALERNRSPQAADARRRAQSLKP